MINENFRILSFQNFIDERGNLVAVETGKDIPFEIKRVYYIFGADQNAKRAFHAHHNTDQVLICLKGSLKCSLDNGCGKIEFNLENPNNGVFIKRKTWLELTCFSPDCILLVLASSNYDSLDYIRDYNLFCKLKPKEGAQND